MARTERSHNSSSRESSPSPTVASGLGRWQHTCGGKVASLLRDSGLFPKTVNYIHATLHKALEPLEKMAHYEAHLSRPFHKSLHELEALQVSGRRSECMLVREQVSGPELPCPVRNG